MVSALVQLRWLLWKNWVVVKRRYFATPLEFLIPALIPVIMLLIRQKVISYEVDTPTEWAECTTLCRFPTGLNFSSLYGLAYYPDSDFTNKLMQRVVTNSPYLTRFSKAQGGFKSEQEMVDFLQKMDGTEANTKNYAAGIVFDTLDGSYKSAGGEECPTQIKYKIRLPATPRNRLKTNNEMNPFSSDSNWRTQNVFPNPMPTKPRETPQNCSSNPNYQQEGFTAIQCAIDAAIVELVNGSVDTNRLGGLQVTGQRNPFPQYYNDRNIVVIQQNFANMLLVAFFCTILNAAGDVTSEREDKLKETLRMMGVSSSVQWLAWIIRYVASSIIICFLQVLFYTIPTPGHPPVIPHSDPTLIFVFMLLTALASISFAFMVSSFFSSASSAAVATAVLYLASFAPYSFIQLRYGSISLAVKMAMMLISTVGMGFGGLLIGNFESLGTGAVWSKVDSPVSVDDPLTLALVFTMLIVDIVLYCSIAFYVETVRPGEFGVPQPWYFPVMPSFWCSNQERKVKDGAEEGETSRPASVPSYANKTWFEPSDRLAASMPDPVVKIRDLTRRFGKSKTAVDSLSLDLYEEHITCLLGHNGSGKTTTMLMLTGFLAPTSGTAQINGCDIRRAADLTSIRHQLGLCPQHDVLFRQLTVSEHLKLFALLKGCSSGDLKQEVEEALASVNLKSKRNEYARNMSGGQKRRLSVACALIGGSKIVILDEPTSGLDPDARRSLWDVIERARKNRAILLTTHFLEEADFLADRIAVLSGGRLRCVGSPMFLKRTLGGGYRLNIEVKPKPEGNLKALNEIVRQTVPNAELWSQTLRNELLYTLPVGATTSKNNAAEVAKLMDELEKEGPRFGMQSLGLTASSMEDVFVVAGIAKEFDENKSSRSSSPDVPLHNYQQNNQPAREPRNLEADDSQEQERAGEEELTSTPKDGVFKAPILWLVQVYALCVKHAICIFRSPLVLLAQLFVPLIFTGLAVVIMKTIPGLSEAPALLLTPDHYSSPIVTAFSPSAKNCHVMEAYRETMKSHYPDAKYTEVDSSKFTNLEAFLEVQGQANLPDYRTLYNLGALFDEANSKLVAYFNGDAYHSVSVSLGAAFSGLLNSVTGEKTPRFRLETVNHPLPATPFERAANDELEYTNGFILSGNIMFGLAVYMGCCVMQPVAEQMCQSKLLQFIAGTSPAVYWLATFVCQLLLLMPSTALIVGLFAVTDIQAYVGDDRAAHFFLIMALFFAAAGPQNYLMSLLFNQPNRALVWLILWNLMTAEVTLLAVGILELPSLELQDVGRVCRRIFTYFLPQFNTGRALQDYYVNWVENSICDNPQVVQLCQLVVLFNVTQFPFPCCPKPYCGSMCWTPTANYLSYEDKNGIGEFLVALACQSVVYSTLLLLVDYRVFHGLFAWLKRVFSRICCLCCCNSQSASRASLVEDDGNNEPVPPVIGAGGRRLQIEDGEEEEEEEDEDVASERRQVDLLKVQGLKAGLQVCNVMQRFSSSVLAVAGVTFAAPPGAVFGLLGFNGAGKSTLYRIIIADLAPTDGDVRVAGHSVRRSPNTARSRLGYCPQAVSSIDGLQDQLTGRQQLRLMARLRGIRGDVDGYCSRLLDLLYLTRFADRPSHEYSGGMRRKLSTAVSLIGRPPVILLDEPTTGMDPAARRQFWRVVDQLRRDGSTVILTSHSMDECDLLCDKIAVMVKGRLACIGSPSHLKARFGGGMILTAKAPTVSGLQAMASYIEENISGVTLRDSHLGTATYTISYLPSVQQTGRKNKQMAQSWSVLFSVLERGRSELGLIEDYSLSHTTLERVFLSFASGSQQKPSSNSLIVVPPEPPKEADPNNTIFSIAL